MYNSNKFYYIITQIHIYPFMKLITTDEMINILCENKLFVQIFKILFLEEMYIYCEK